MSISHCDRAGRPQPLPDVSHGEFLTRWTVRLALLAYAAALALRLAAPARRGMARAVWTAGCLLFLAHVACAFQFYHAWSHARAYAETARQTREMTGWDWGGGLWLNYLFALAWVADVAYWWWGGLDAYQRKSAALSVALQAFLAFMAFNGAVVFAARPTRWVGLAISIVLLLLLLLRLRRFGERRAGGPG